MKQIKSITTDKFEVILLKTPSEAYMVSFQKVSKQPVYSHLIPDFTTASKYFDAIYTTGKVKSEKTNSQYAL